MSQIKLKHSGGNSVIIAAPDSNPASDRTLKLPGGADGEILTDQSTLSASNLTSGTIPDARFPATLPAVSGANLTGIASDCVKLIAGKYDYSAPGISEIVFDNLDPATYGMYIFNIHTDLLSDDAYPEIQFKHAGSYLSSGHIYSYTGTHSGSTRDQGNGAFIRLGDQAGKYQHESPKIHMTITIPVASDEIDHAKVWGHNSWKLSNTYQKENRFEGSVQDGSTQITGFRFYLNSQNIQNASYGIWGFKR